MLKLLCLAAAAAAIGAGVAIVPKSVPHDPHQNERTERISDLSTAGDGAHELSIKSSVGDIQVVTGDSQELKVHAVRWTKNADTESGRRWLNDSRVEVERSGDVLRIVDHPFGRDSQAKLDNVDGGIDLIITAPRGLEVNLDLSAGDANLTGDFRSLKGGVGAGDLSLVLDSSLQSDSSLKLGAGDAKVDFKHGYQGNLIADVGVGDVSGIPAPPEGDGEIRVGRKSTVKIGAGGAPLTIHVGAGDIKVSGDSIRSERPSKRSSATIDVEEDDGFQSVRDSDQDEKDDVKIPDVDRIVKQALRAAQPEIDRASRKELEDADRELKEVGPEVDLALSEAMKQKIDVKLPDINRIVKEALRAAQPEIDRETAKGLEDADRQMKLARPEIDRAIEQAMRALDHLDLKEIQMKDGELKLKMDRGDLKLHLKGLSKQISREVEEAMRELRKNLRKHPKLSDSDSE